MTRWEFISPIRRLCSPAGSEGTAGGTQETATEPTDLCSESDFQRSQRPSSENTFRDALISLAVSDRRRCIYISVGKFARFRRLTGSKWGGDSSRPLAPSPAKPREFLCCESSGGFAQSLPRVHSEKAILRLDLFANSASKVHENFLVRLPSVSLSA